MRALVAGVAVLAACAAVIVAYITWGELGYGDAGYRPTPLLVAQLVVAAIGLIPVALFAYSIVRGRKRSTLVVGVVAVIAYLAWAVLNDASVHGWSHLNVF